MSRGGRGPGTEGREGKGAEMEGWRKDKKTICKIGTEKDKCKCKGRCEKESVRERYECG